MIFKRRPESCGLTYGGEKLDQDGKVAAAIAADGQPRPGADPYWDFLGQRRSCDACGDAYKYGNLVICPNGFGTTCYRHEPRCPCGHQELG
jgi:hypothetical protein